MYRSAYLLLFSGIAMKRLLGIHDFDERLHDAEREINAQNTIIK
jgi:hypothetical protein